MGEQIRESFDEINLYDLWKVIVKRKKLIVGLFIGVVTLTAIISFNMPKIYIGEAVLMVQSAANITAKDIVDFVGNLDEGKKAKMLPTTSALINDIKLSPLKESKDKISVIIEAKDPNAIKTSLSEIIEYISAIDIVRNNVKEERERLLTHSSELSIVIADTSELLDTYRTLLTRGKLVPVGFNPVDLNKRISDIKMEKLVVEQSIHRMKDGIEIASQLYIKDTPVRPRTTMSLAFYGILSLFLGIFLAFSLEYVEKIKNCNSV